MGGDRVGIVGAERESIVDAVISGA